jgi:hypothetical protein
MFDDRDHRTYRLGVIVVAMAIRCSYDDSAYCRRTNIVLPMTTTRHRSDDESSSWPSFVTTVWPRMMVKMDHSTRPLSTTRGGRSCCRRWKNHADGYIPVPSRAVFFVNAFRLLERV